VTRTRSVIYLLAGLFTNGVPLFKVRWQLLVINWHQKHCVESRKTWYGETHRGFWRV